MVLPVTFIPVLAPHGKGANGGKLRPGAAGGPQQLHPSGSGSFTIPAYARPLTQLDFISTGGSSGLSPG
jgi:hypothetical protein